MRGPQGCCSTRAAALRGSPLRAGMTDSITPPRAAPGQRRPEREAVDEALQEFLRALVADIAVIVDQVRLERDVGFAAEQSHAEAEHDRAQMLLHQRAADGARRGAGDEARLAGPRVLAVAAARPNRWRSSAPSGIERLCSGVTIRTPSAFAISSLKRTTSAGRLPSLSWLYIGRSSMRTILASNLPAPSLTSAWASLRLIDSRRLEPTMTAICGFGHAVEYLG